MVDHVVEGKTEAVATYSAVVPANAGTHNHRKWFGEDSMFSTLATLQSIDSAVWVPAFAGTTRSAGLSTSLRGAFATKQSRLLRCARSDGTRGGNRA